MLRIMRINFVFLMLTLSNWASSDKQDKETPYVEHPSALIKSTLQMPSLSINIDIIPFTCQYMPDKLGTELSVHSRIQSDFIWHVYHDSISGNERKEAAECLDLGSGWGTNLANVLADPLNKKIPIRYTAIDKDQTCIQNMIKLFSTQDKLRDKSAPQNYLGYANKDVFDYFKTNRNNKLNKFDFIYSSQLTHFFTPSQQCIFFQNCYDFLKTEGRFFLLQSGIIGIDAKETGENYQTKVKNSNLWPGYTPLATQPTRWAVPELSNLLKAFGFKILMAKNVAQMTSLQSGTVLSSIGFIVEKTNTQDAEALKKYIEAAQALEKTQDALTQTEKPPHK